MNFRLEDAGDGTTLITTETRIYATDASARRRFAGYWRVIYPGSALIRRMWLRAIARRAETLATRSAGRVETATQSRRLWFALSRSKLYPATMTIPA
jgi:hypothetical protein